MFGFGRKKKEEAEKAAAEEKAKEEQLTRKMRTMNDQLSSKTKEIADLEKQLAATSKQAATGDEAKKKLTEAQEQVRKMQLEVAKLQIETQAAQNKARQAMQAAAEAAAEAANAETEPGVVPVPGAAAGATAPELAVGVNAWVRKAGGMNLRLRDRPGLQSNAFAGLPPGTQMTLLEGPVPLDNYPWWRVRVSDGREGWVAGSELVTQPES